MQSLFDEYWTRSSNADCNFERMTRYYGAETSFVNVCELSSLQGTHRPLLLHESRGESLLQCFPESISGDATFDAAACSLVQTQARVCSNTRQPHTLCRLI